jgi:HTH-type transcriptional regulator, transcriptional repressor of NAD biosynthesis genes
MKNLKNTVGIFGGRFTPLHNGHVGAILRAAEEVDTLYVILSYAISDPIPGEIRLRWLKAVFSPYPNIIIVDVQRDKILETVGEWVEDSSNIRLKIASLTLDMSSMYGDSGDHVKIDKVFVGSNDHGNMFKICYPEAEVVVLDPLRSDIDISGTEIRQNIYKYWEYLPKFVRKDYAKQVIVLDDKLRNQLTDRFSTVKVEDIRKRYEGIYGPRVVFQPDISSVISAKERIACDEASYNANKVYFVPKAYGFKPPYLVLKSDISLDDAIEQVKNLIK